MASASGNAARTNTALEYFSAAAAPNSTPASAAPRAPLSVSSTSRPARISGARSGSRNELPTIAQNTPVATPSALAREDSDDALPRRQVREKHPCDQVEQGDAGAVGHRKRDRGDHAVPAGGHHQEKRQIADRVEIALRAGGEKILLQPAGKQLERQVVVIVEQVPIKVLAGKHGPHRAERGGHAKHQDSAARVPRSRALRCG